VALPVLCNRDWKCLDSEINKRGRQFGAETGSEQQIVRREY